MTLVQDGLVLSEMLWSQGLQHSEIAAVVIDPVGNRIVQCAEQPLRRLTGMSPGAWASTPASDLFPGQLPQLVVLTQGCLSDGRAWDDSLEIQARSGLRPVEVSASAFDFGETQLVTLLIADRDALDHRRCATPRARTYESAEDAASAAEVFRNFETANRLILEAAGEGIYGVDDGGLTTFVNPAAERMLGWRSEELVGQMAHSMIHHSHECGDHYPINDCPIYAAFHDGSVHHVSDEVFWRKNGTSFPVEYTSTPIRRAGECVGAVIVFRDISERRDAEKKLKSALAEVEALKSRLEQENAYLQHELWREHNHRAIIGDSRAIRTILQQIDLVAPTDATVLITGESGTGKELIARAIHESGGRAGRPLIRVNCAAIPKELFESEFFGHAKGAFTGANEDRVGRFELADGGTIFLDEVGELPLDQQSKLLRVLQEQQFERVGEATTRQVDVRVIAATNENLLEAVDNKTFREDLFFRLNVFPIEAPPLRQRKEDIPRLALHFVEKVSNRLNKPAPAMSEAIAERLKSYDWPGNIRELENAIERAVILARDGKLQLGPLGSPGGVDEPRDAEPEGSVHTEAMRRAQTRADVIRALKLANGRVSGEGGAAERLGLKPTTLYSRLARLKIDARLYRDA
ncbi:MAG: sigma 54-interacting transcriptional regulator [Pseudomonadota bacterium]